MQPTLNFQEILSAEKQLAGVSHQTPVLTSRTLNQRAGCEVWLKCENLQRMGAFKFRGAYNRISRLTEEQKRRGVIAFSSGNHAQATALAAGLLGVPAVLCMPMDAPGVKVDATREYGAEVIFYDRFKEDREEVATRTATDRSLTLIPPYDHPHIMAGAGTAALELLREVPDLDSVIAPVGGGGLLSGTSVAAKGVRPQICVFGVEPETADDTRRSLQAGKRIAIPAPHTLADGLRVTIPGEATFPVIQQHAEKIVTVSEREIRAALRFALFRMKLVVEPSGAVPLAALLFRRLPRNLRRIGVIISGGNIDPSVLAEISQGE
ncbi:pyridoxal-phosphate dependent enzyme [Kroppenstedtia eburnea]|uniref:threonine ammonia-lyase n=1 Tax=Kroppenstedtia eburnea TaxID=714067 RepID=A0A1N7PVZ8_9BACL|nr:pyridoxal-phosphate dependent enzyme [Kroppenstedtia eburnea]EGK09197.1 threonine ammonia-lyase [Desmospora sp. 8437]QKI80929.1 pyridoxal-phosphate dependent enzyme [Kroppenstedtia eburnea]SIT14725.1 L-threonine ammonia-lyase [Kroppenstedtia eburnea]